MTSMIGLILGKSRRPKKFILKVLFFDSKGNSRKTWQTINELTCKKSSNLSVKEVEVDVLYISNSQQLSDAFNELFSTIGLTLANEIRSDENIINSHLKYLTRTDKMFEIQPTDNNKVRSLLSKLCKSKATGLDKISARLLRECPDLISHSLCEIFNRSIMTGIFPEEWKCSKVVPLYKQGELADINNYRPISIIPVVAKVFERIIFDQLYVYLRSFLKIT